MHGIIALDIDGTVTNAQHEMTPGVERFLAELSRDWEIIFITGRSFPYGYAILQVCSFPYHYCVYNGAVTFRMPEQQIERRHYLDASILPALEAACVAEGLDFLVHTGGDLETRCYFRPKGFDVETRDYFKRWRQVPSEPWIAVEDFSHLGTLGLCYAKVFGLRDPLLRIAKALESERVVSSVVHDPMRPSHCVMLVTNPMATKGAALREFRGDRNLPVIAAGDDDNDLSMFAEADIALVMETAPPEVRKVGAIIAPPSDEEGIIEGLRHAIAELER